MGFWTAVFGLFAALLSVVGILLGFFLSDARGDVADLQIDKSKLVSQVAGLKEQAARDTGTIDALRSQIATLDKRISDQDVQIQNLQQQVPPVVAEADVPNVRTNNTITLAEDGDTIDLDSTERNWGAGATSIDTDTVVLRGGRLMFGYDMSYVRLPKGQTASYRTCAVASGFARLDYLFGEAPDLTSFQDRRMCLRLGTGRYATIRATRIQTSSVDLAITVWELP